MIPNEQGTEIVVVEDACTWYFDRYFLVGRERVLWMRADAAQLYVAGVPGRSVTGHALRRLRAALAMSDMPELTLMERETFNKQYLYALAQRERPLLDEVNEALLAARRLASIEGTLRTSCAQLPEDTEQNRAMIRDVLAQWRAGQSGGKRSQKIASLSETLVCKRKTSAAVDQARKQALAEVRRGRHG